MYPNSYNKVVDPKKTNDWSDKCMQLVALTGQHVSITYLQVSGHAQSLRGVVGLWCVNKLFELHLYVLQLTCSTKTEHVSGYWIITSELNENNLF